MRIKIAQYVRNKLKKTNTQIVEDKQQNNNMQRDQITKQRNKLITHA